MAVMTYHLIVAITALTLAVILVIGLVKHYKEFSEDRIFITFGGIFFSALIGFGFLYNAAQWMDILFTQ